MRLEDKVAIITGGANGMGAEEARMFAREGAKVLLVDFQEDRARETRQLIQEEGGVASTFQGDMTKLEDCQNMVGAAMDRYGRVDILDNNVGISQRGTVVEVSEEDWDRVHAINLKGVWLCMKYEIQQFLAQGDRTMA